MTLNYTSLLGLDFKNSELIRVYSKIPKEIQEAIKESGCAVTEVLREGVYRLIEEGLLVLPEIEISTRKISLQEINKGNNHPISKSRTAIWNKARM